MTFIPRPDELLKNMGLYSCFWTALFLPLTCKVAEKIQKDDDDTCDEWLNSMSLTKPDIDHCTPCVDQVKTVFKMEGDTFTLPTGVTDAQPYDRILWQYGPQEIIIVDMLKDGQCYFNNDDIFKRKLHPHKQNGDLTITNATTPLSGNYKVTIVIKGTIHCLMFKLTVCAFLQVPNITSMSTSNSKCSKLCSVTSVTPCGNVTDLSWYRGNSLFSTTIVSDLKKNISLPLEIECLDDSYSCVLSNPISNQTQHLNSSELCQPCPETKVNVLIILIIFLGILAIIAAVYCRKVYCKCRDDEENSFSPLVLLLNRT